MDSRFLYKAVSVLTKPAGLQGEASVEDKAAALKQLKSHAKQGNAQVEEVLEALWTSLLTNSSEVRR
jgi:hypothetical protein